MGNGQFSSCQTQLWARFTQIMNITVIECFGIFPVNFSIKINFTGLLYVFSDLLHWFENTASSRHEQRRLKHACPKNHCQRITGKQLQRTNYEKYVEYVIIYIKKIWQLLANTNKRRKMR